MIYLLADLSLDLRGGVLAERGVLGVFLVTAGVFLLAGVETVFDGVDSITIASLILFLVIFK